VKSAADDSNSTAIATEYKVELKSKMNLNGIYFVIVSPATPIFKTDYKEYDKQSVDGATSFVIDLSGNNTAIEFAVQGKHNAEEFKMFMSPKLSTLEAEETAVCGDGICGAGESFETCPLDCKKPYGKAIVWIIIIAVIVVAGLIGIWKYYAVMYDKKLQEKLFPQKEDFHKLTFFISNEINKGLEDNEIKENLEKAGWKSSQADYALKRVKQSANAMQKKSILAYVQRELAMGKDKDSIKDRLSESGWKHSMIKWALKKAEAK
jgi:flagellar basal body-associated protein FliL